MSIEGVEQSKKHGGAHPLPHEFVVNSDLPVPKQFVISSNYFKDHTTESGSRKIQDGDQAMHDNEENGCIPESLHFLSEELDGYDQAVVENNTEWLKSRCKPLEHVDFDLGSNNAGDDHLEFPGISLEAKTLLDEGRVGHHDVHVSDSLNNNNSAITADMSLSAGQAELTHQTNFLVQQMANEINQNSSVSVISMDNTPMVSMESESELPVFVNSADLPNMESLFGLKEKTDIEAQPPDQMYEKVNLFSSDFQNVEHLMLEDFKSNGAKSNVRVVLSENGVLTLIPNDQEYDSSAIVNDSAIENGPDQMNALQVPDCSIGSISLSESLQNSGILNSLAANSNQKNEAANENVALATISISNDKLANSTKILVDTSQGQQLYQLNMSDLTGLLNSSGNGLTPATTATSPATAAAERTETGETVLPGYLLLPVPNPQGSETGMFTLANPQGNANGVGADHRLKRQQMYMCTQAGCGKLFKTLSKLTVHTNSFHTGDRPYKCSEPGCDWAFTKSYKLKRHEESHRGCKNHICPYCKKKFTTIYNLRSHIRQHSRPCKEECEVEGCGEKFQTRRDLDKHMKTHEGVEKTYKCPYEGCNKLFLSAHCLGSHPRVHTAEPVDLTCNYEGCGRKFEKLCRLKQHQRAHTGERPYTCHYGGCNWAFSTASKLTRHMTKHTNQRKWMCKECGKSFMRAEHLKGHMITHSGIKPFACPVQGCGQKFVAKSSVYVHLKKHENMEKEPGITYHCPMEICDKKYSNKAKLRQHIVKHFPGTLKPEDAAQLDIVPLLRNENHSDKELVVQPSAVSVKTTADGKMTIDPVEFIATQVEDESTNQYTAELTAELSSMVAVANFALNENQHVTQPKISIKKESGESCGSARTDYQSNKLLSERARKRRKLLKEKCDSSALSEVAVDEQPSTSPSFSPATNESLSSHGITFRDPETGVLYVQTQLLQDDPPHPDLYSEMVNENGLNGELPLPTDTDLPEQVVGSSEFVGSTINLQDLVG